MVRLFQNFAIMELSLEFTFTFFSSFVVIGSMKSLICFLFVAIFICVVYAQDSNGIPANVEIPYDNLPYCFNITGVNYEVCYGFFGDVIAVCLFVIFILLRDLDDLFSFLFFVYFSFQIP